jgi:acetylornithine deacetylase/succinyl-diaminopimelate desuccinylase-like protein
MHRLWLVLLLATACAVTPPLSLEPVPPHGALPPLDWEKAGDEAVATLQAYLRIDTTNPPGREAAGVDFLAELLRREGIESERLEHAPGRPTLVARLKGNGSQKPLCLMSHVDVVTAEDAKWPADHGPRSGTLDADGMIWGRGALDMKGLGVLELLTMVWLKRLGVPLSRDVILLAVADEEVDNGGARMLAEPANWARLGCSHLVNEGGMGVKDGIFPGQTVWGISVAEKGVLWVRMVATGEPGHGSTVFPGRAPARLVDAINKLRARTAAPAFHPALFTLLREIGAQQGVLSGFLLERPSLVQAFVAPRLMAQPPSQALLTDTVQVTGFAGQLAPNVLPSEVSATLDCRLLPGTTPDAMLARLAAIVDDPAVRFEVLHSFPAYESPVDDPLFRALGRHAIAGRPDAALGPALSVGFTDSLYFRPLGVRAYGFAPFEVTLDELSRIHGTGERLSAANVRSGLRAFLLAIAEVAAAP